MLGDATVMARREYSKDSKGPTRNSIAIPELETRFRDRIEFDILPYIGNSLVSGTALTPQVYCDEHRAPLPDAQARSDVPCTRSRPATGTVKVRHDGDKGGAKSELSVSQ